MKLAEALNRRADLAKRIAQLGARLDTNAKVTEGDSPAEDPMELLEELSQLTGQLEDLIAKINCSNSMITHEGKTLTQLLAAGGHQPGGRPPAAEGVRQAVRGDT